MSPTLSRTQSARWLPVSFDPSSGTVATGCGLSWNNLASTLPETTSGIGWFYSSDFKTLIPAITLQGPTRLIAISQHNSFGLLQAIAQAEHEMLHSIARLAYHDFNGKIMGIDGILGLWSMQPPDPATAESDIVLIKDSLQHLIKMLRLIDSGTDPRQSAPKEFDLKELHHLTHDWLIRHFSPPNSLEYAEPISGTKIKAAPLPLLRTLWTSARFFSRIRKQRESVKFNISASETGIVLSVSTSTIIETLQTLKPSNRASWTSTEDDWLLLSAYYGMRWTQPNAQTAEFQFDLKPVEAPSPVTITKDPSSGLNASLKAIQEKALEVSSFHLSGSDKWEPTESAFISAAIASLGSPMIPWNNNSA